MKLNIRNSGITLWLFYHSRIPLSPATMSHFPKARLERLEHVSVCFMFLPVRISCVMCLALCGLCVCVRACVREGSKVCCSLGLGQPFSLEANLECKPYHSVAVNIYLEIFGNAFGPRPLGFNWRYMKFPLFLR